MPEFKPWQETTCEQCGSEFSDAYQRGYTDGRNACAAEAQTHRDKALYMETRDDLDTVRDFLFDQSKVISTRAVVAALERIDACLRGLAK